MYEANTNSSGNIKVVHDSMKNDKYQVDNKSANSIDMDVDIKIDKTIINLAGQLTVLETLLKKKNQFYGTTKESFHLISKSLLRFHKEYKYHDDKINSENESKNTDDDDGFDSSKMGEEEKKEDEQEDDSHDDTEDTSKTESTNIDVNDEDNVEERKEDTEVEQQQTVEVVSPMTQEKESKKSDYWNKNESTEIVHDTEIEIGINGQQEEENEEEKEKANRLQDARTKILAFRYFAKEGGKIPLSSLNEVKQFVHDSNLESCGKFWDAFSLMATADFNTEEKIAERRETAHSQHSSLFEYDLMTTMALKKPGLKTLLRDSRPEGQDDLDYGFFRSCRLYEEWIGPDGIQESLSTWLGNYCARIECYVYCNSDSDDDVESLDHKELRPLSTAPHQLLALTMLEVAKVHISRLETFVDKFYRQLTDEGNVSKDKAWSLVGRCVDRIFGQMYDARLVGQAAIVDCAKNNINTKRKKRESMIAPMLWSILQSFEVFSTYVRVGFYGHHVFQEEIMCFSMKERNQFSVTIESLLLQQNATKQRCDRHEERDERHGEEIQTLHTMVEELKKELNQIKEKQKQESSTASNHPRSNETERLALENPHEVKCRRLETAKVKIRSMGTKSGQINQMPFSSLEEVQQWVKDADVTSYGEFWDLFSLLSAMDPQFMTSKSVKARLVAAERANQSLLEFDLASTMNQNRPGPKYMERKREDSSYGNDVDCGFFRTCDSYAKWTQDARTLGSWLSQFCKSIEETVVCSEDYKKPDVDITVELLSLNLLYTAKSQFNTLRYFIDKILYKLTTEKNIHMSKAWPLVGRCVDVVFNEMLSTRRAVHLTNETLQRNMVPTNYHNKELKQSMVTSPMVYCILQCVETFEMFVNVQFWDHPLIQKEIDSFYLKERQREQYLYQHQRVL